MDREDLLKAPIIPKRTLSPDIILSLDIASAQRCLLFEDVSSYNDDSDNEFFENPDFDDTDYDPDFTFSRNFTQEIGSFQNEKTLNIRHFYNLR